MGKIAKNYYVHRFHFSHKLVINDLMLVRVAQYVKISAPTSGTIITKNIVNFCKVSNALLNFALVIGCNDPLDLNKRL